MPNKYAMRFKNISPYILFEVHMNNANRASGILSQPGFRISVVRQSAVSPPNSLLEASWVLMGVQLNELAIPPRENYVEVTTNFTFPTSLPSNAFMTILASFSHMHYLGRRVFVEQRRVQGEPQNLACNPQYSNEDQEVVPLIPALNITVGDEIVVHCIYNSSKMVNVTRGGEEVRRNSMMRDVQLTILLTRLITKCASCSYFTTATF
jgi:hypothetical protein